MLVAGGRDVVEGVAGGPGEVGGQVAEGEDEEGG